MTHTFRAIWPICDPTVPGTQLAAEVRGDLPGLARQALAVVTGPGRFYVAPSRAVPGSRGATSHVLVYEAPARALEPRAYRRPR